MAEYDRYDTENSGGSFMLGLLTGTVLGAGLGMLLAPRAGSEIRGAIGQQARRFGSTVSEQYRRATEQATEWAGRAREAVSRGAEQVRGYGTAATGTTGTTGATGTAYGSEPGRTSGEMGRS